MLAKINNYSVPTFWDDFFTDFVPSRYYGRNFATTPAVNIMEEDKEFRIDIAVPGLGKDDFTINLEDNVLSISSERKAEKQEEKSMYKRQEFNYASFCRSFRMNDSIDQEKINAKHSDGILSVFLPKKKEAVKQGPKQISIK
ncbi:Hsp20/alpha crystallin family protein [Bacteroidota bacterium]